MFVILVSRFLIKLSCFPQILRHPQSKFVGHAEISLRASESLISCFLKKGCCFPKILSSIGF